MKVKDIFDQMLHGEFMNTYLTCRDEEGQLTKVDAMVVHINAGIIELHKRFMIRKGIAYLCCDGCQTDYKIYRGAPYLECFEDRDLMEILEVVECCGKQTRMNATHRKYDYTPKGRCNPMDVTTSAYNVLRVPKGFCGFLQISYKPSPWLIEYSLDKRTDFIPEAIPRYGQEGIILGYDFQNIPKEKVTPTTILDTEIDLPEMYMMALLYFIASRIFVNLQQETRQDPIDRKYLEKYEMECQRLIQLGYDMEGAGAPEERFVTGGFV